MNYGITKDATYEFISIHEKIWLKVEMCDRVDEGIVTKTLFCRLFVVIFRR